MKLGRSEVLRLEKAGRLPKGTAASMGKKSKSETSLSLIDEITNARAKVVCDSHSVTIDVDILMPSLNKIMRMNHFIFDKLNKVWHSQVNAWLFDVDKSIFRDKPVFIHVREYSHHAHDVDNVICKSLIDGIVHSGFIKDDDSRFVKGYSVYEPVIEKGRRTIITISTREDYEQAGHYKNH